MAAAHPSSVQPSNRFSANIAQVCVCDRIRAITVGKKYRATMATNIINIIKTSIISASLWVCRSLCSICSVHKFSQPPGMLQVKHVCSVGFQHHQV